MIGAFCIAFHDNRSTAFANRPALNRCGTCRLMISKWEEPLTGLVVKNKRLDISTTYDAVFVASTAFRNVYDAHRMVGLLFATLPDDPKFFHVTSDIVVKFDFDKRGTRFIDRCPSCRQYKAVIGATPVFLTPDATIPENGFVRTDIEFGNGDAKGPLILCGNSAGSRLAKAKLKGVDLVQIGIYPSPRN